MIDKGRPSRSFVLAALAWNLILATCLLADQRTGPKGPYSPRPARVGMRRVQAAVGPSRSLTTSSLARPLENMSRALFCEILERIRRLEHFNIFCSHLGRREDEVGKEENATLLVVG